MVVLVVVVVVLPVAVFTRVWECPIRSYGQATRQE
ncbi:hypothetical protein E2C01_086315 [Portunus trituberculatus]|uniref:Uncharacterized protein n=1 Tax=Portunus trituberculatus TaxID=210409 RepID=A0A5B7J3G8_PORTR|nr:hypothetical protein [Portunus trituberculatus]